MEGEISVIKIVISSVKLTAIDFNLILLFSYAITWLCISQDGYVHIIQAYSNSASRIELCSDMGTIPCT